MKPILIFGASTSAAAMAAGFAVLANQAMPSRATEVEVIRPANVAREIVEPARHIRNQPPRITARPVAAAPAGPIPAPTAAAIPDALRPDTPALAALLDKDAAQGARMYLLPPSGAATSSGLATRPVPRPVVLAADAALPMVDLSLGQQLDPGAASRFDFIPLIGVYR